MSRSVNKGNAFVSERDVADRPTSPPLTNSRPASLHSGELRSDELTDERSDERKSDKRSLRAASEDYRRRDSFGEKSEGYERGYASSPVAATGKQPVTNCTSSLPPLGARTLKEWHRHRLLCTESFVHSPPSILALVRSLIRFHERVLMRL